MKIPFTAILGICKILKVAAILIILFIIGTTSYYLYEISVNGDPAITPSSPIPYFLILGGLIAALGFLIAGIYRNREARILREKLDYREQEITEYRERIKELENPLGYELLEDPFSP